MTNRVPPVTVTVYTTGPSCMACSMTKRHLKRRGIPFTETAIDSDENILAAITELGLSTAPVVCISIDGTERYWDGYRPDRIDDLAVEISAACPICGPGTGSVTCFNCREVANR